MREIKNLYVVVDECVLIYCVAWDSRIGKSRAVIGFDVLANILSQRVSQSNAILSTEVLPLRVVWWVGSLVGSSYPPIAMRIACSVQGQDRYSLVCGRCVCIGSNGWRPWVPSSLGSGARWIGIFYPDVGIALEVRPSVLAVENSLIGEEA